jgi:hypothetical protein
VTNARRPPIAHLVLLALMTLAFVVGGRVAFASWGQAPVRPLIGYLALAVIVHAASRFVPRHSLAVRSVAWLTVAIAPLHLTTLLRPEVLLPVIAFGLVDLAQHRAGRTMEAEVPAGSLAKGIAGLATVGLVVILAVLVTLAKSTAILGRLGLVAAAGWGLVTVFALRPATRTRWTLLGGAGTLALTFALLAAPVLPFGPLLTYWTAIAAVLVAVATATVTETDPEIREGHRVHEQTVHELPDPVAAPLAERVHQVLTGGDARSLSHRVEQALDRPADGQLLERRIRQLQEEGLPAHRARRVALADILDVDLDELDGGTT